MRLLLGICAEQVLARVGEAAFQVEAFLFNQGGLIFFGRVGDGDNHGPHEGVAGSGDFFEFGEAAGGVVGSVFQNSWSR